MIVDIQSSLPDRIVSNDELAALYVGWTADKIFEKTGIKSRHVANDTECASDLAVRAAEKLLPEKRAKVDYLLFCTQTPDYLLPTTACLIQHRLGLPISCGALDINIGCSGYVYCLGLAQSLLESRLAKGVLLLTADTYSRLIHPLDKSVRTIFGDAGTATFLSNQSDRKLHAFVFGSDGSGGSQLIVQRGGMRHPYQNDTHATVDDSGNIRDANCLQMNGPEIFNFTLRTVPELVKNVLAKAHCSLQDIDLFVFHQANAYMLEFLRRKMNLPKEKFLVELEDTGNTVSSSIPLVLQRAAVSERLRPGMRILVAGFGVGYSWAGCIIDW